MFNSIKSRKGRCFLYGIIFPVGLSNGWNQPETKNSCCFKIQIVSRNLNTIKMIGRKYRERWSRTREIRSWLFLSLQSYIWWWVTLGFFQKLLQGQGLQKEWTKKCSRVLVFGSSTELPNISGNGLSTHSYYVIWDTWTLMFCTHKWV